MGVQLDLIEKSGAWFSHKGTKMGQGKENSKVYLQEHPELSCELEAQIRKALLQDRVSLPSSKVAAETAELKEEIVE